MSVMRTHVPWSLYKLSIALVSFILSLYTLGEEILGMKTIQKVLTRLGNKRIILFYILLWNTFDYLFFLLSQPHVLCKDCHCVTDFMSALSHYFSNPTKYLILSQFYNSGNRHSWKVSYFPRVTWLIVVQS